MDTRIGITKVQKKTRRKIMELIKVEKYLPASARSASHKSAVEMESYVKAIAESNEGKLVSFKISEPGTALIFVSGDTARQQVLREFKKLDGVVVSETSGLLLQQEKNKKLQEKSDQARARYATRTAVK
jgi:hypothetical protein